MINSEDMVIYSIPKECKDMAAKTMFNNGVEHKARSMFRGLLAEMAFLSWYRQNSQYTIVRNKNKHHDFIIKHPEKDIRVDICCTTVKSVPKLNHNASVSAKKIDNECDLYVFTMMNEEETELHIIGSILKDSYFYNQNLNFIKANTPGFFKTMVLNYDCYLLSYRYLEPIASIL